jgi:hypothetical protein
MTIGDNVVTDFSNRVDRALGRRQPQRTEEVRSMALPQSIRNAGEPWSRADLARLKELAADNIPPSVIGLRLGRPEESVLMKALQVGITLTPLNKPPYGDLS